MANPWKKNFLPLPAGRYGKLTHRSTQQRHQANEGKSSLEPERVLALGALRTLRSNKKLAAKKWRETHFLSNKEKEQWIEDYVERETSGARQRVQDAAAAVQQEQEDMKHAEIAGLINREPKWTFDKMMVAIRESLSDLASSNKGEDREDEDNEDTEQGKLSEDDEPGWVMGTINKTVSQRVERFWQKQIKLDELTEPGWEDAAGYIHERDKKYCTSELMVLAVVQQHTDDDALAPALTTFGERMECYEIVPGISPMPQGTSRAGSSHMRLG